MFDIKNEFRIIKNGLVFKDWTTQMVVDSGLFMYVSPTVIAQNYTCKFGNALTQVLPSDTQVDNAFSTSNVVTSPKSEYKTSLGKAIALLSFNMSPVSQPTYFNQIGVYVNNVLFSKLAYDTTFILLPDEVVEVQYRISLAVSRTPFLTTDAFFTYRTLAGAWFSGTPWSALPKGMKIDEASLVTNTFTNDIISDYVSGVIPDTLTTHSTTPTSVTYKLKWGINKGSGYYQTIWIKDILGRCFQISPADNKKIFKYNQNEFSLLFTITAKR